MGLKRHEITNEARENCVIRSIITYVLLQIVIKEDKVTETWNMRERKYLEKIPHKRLQHIWDGVTKMNLRKVHCVCVCVD